MLFIMSLSKPHHTIQQFDVIASPYTPSWFSNVSHSSVPQVPCTFVAICVTRFILKSFTHLITNTVNGGVFIVLVLFWYYHN